MKRRRSKLFPFTDIVVGLCGALFAAFLFFYMFKDTTHSASAALPEHSPTDVKTNDTSHLFELFKASDDAQKPVITLETVVKKQLEGTKGSYAVVIKNLQTGETYNLNEHKKYETASLYKLWIMATVYDQIFQKKLTENQVLTQSIPILNTKFGIASESAELKEGDISQTVTLALKQMITISHNYSALLLAEKIRLTTVTSFLSQNGFAESNLGKADSLPESTPADIALFYEKMYKGELINKEYSDKMLSLLKEQQKRNKLPKSLPVEVDVAHKTGELGYLSHDAGIVYTPFGNYIIVVMSETNLPTAANDRIADISQAVYEYFKTKSAETSENN